MDKSKVDYSNLPQNKSFVVTKDLLTPNGDFTDATAAQIKQIKKDGFTVHFKMYDDECSGWNTIEVRRDDFLISQSIESMLHIQAEQLADWKLKLNDECYTALESAVLASNIGQIEPYEIKRGQSLDTFIGNWKPGRNNIYF